MNRTNLRTFLIMIVGLLPASRIKNSLLNRAGFRIERNCSIGVSLIISTRNLRLDRGARVNNFNVFRDLQEVSLGSSSVIGSWNWFSAAKEFDQRAIRATLMVGQESAITSRHYFDCSGGVEVGSFSTIAGKGSTVLSHGIEFDRNVQTALPVRVGDYCFVSTGCTLLKGTVLPPRSVLAAGAVLTSRDRVARSGLWAGVPAVWKSEIQGDYFTRDRGRVGVAPDA